MPKIDRINKDKILFEMHKFQEKRSLPFAASVVNQIVLDVEKYPEFLPWCKDAKILSKEDHSFVAELVINFKGFTEKYKSNVNYWQNGEEYHVNVEAISGAFKKLCNKWHVISTKEGCSVDFFIDFEFKSKILDMVIGMVFSITAEKMIGAFEERAKILSILH